MLGIAGLLSCALEKLTAGEQKMCDVQGCEEIKPLTTAEQVSLTMPDTRQRTHKTPSYQTTQRARREMATLAKELDEARPRPADAPADTHKLTADFTIQI